MSIPATAPQGGALCSQQLVVNPPPQAVQAVLQPLEKENAILVLLPEFWPQCTHIVLPAHFTGSLLLWPLFRVIFSHELDLL